MKALALATSLSTERVCERKREREREKKECKIMFCFEYKGQAGRLLVPLPVVGGALLSLLVLRLR